MESIKKKKTQSQLNFHHKNNFLNGGGEGKKGAFYFITKFQ